MIAVITPTGGRPGSFALLAKAINAQTVESFTWIICDDCTPATPLPKVRDGISLMRIRPSWRWDGANTQDRCMAALLDEVPQGASVIVCEDDDYYAPEHLQTMADALADADLVGQRVSHYYNAATMRYRALPGSYHASLGATAMKGDAITLLVEICRRGQSGLDMKLWREFAGSKRLLESVTSVGIKGLPGRGGIGVGHRADFGTPAPGILSKLIGPVAYEYLALA